MSIWGRWVRSLADVRSSQLAELVSPLRLRKGPAYLASGRLARSSGPLRFAMATDCRSPPPPAPYYMMDITPYAFPLVCVCDVADVRGSCILLPIMITTPTVPGNAYHHHENDMTYHDHKHSHAANASSGNGNDSALRIHGQIMILPLLLSIAIVVETRGTRPTSMLMVIVKGIVRNS